MQHLPSYQLIYDARLEEQIPFWPSMLVAVLFGVLGLAPKEADMVDSIPPSYTGGNLDDWRIGKGATMYYPVAVKGALFSVGDGEEDYRYVYTSKSRFQTKDYESKVYVGKAEAEKKKAEVIAALPEIGYGATMIEGSTPPSFCQISSVMKGMNGASTLENVTSTS